MSVSYSSSYNCKLFVHLAPLRPLLVQVPLAFCFHRLLGQQGRYGRVTSVDLLSTLRFLFAIEIQIASVIPDEPVKEDANGGKNYGKIVKRCFSSMNRRYEKMLNLRTDRKLTE